MSYLKDREIWLSNVPTGNPPAGYFWKFIQNGKVVVRDSSGNDQMMIATSGSQAITGSLIVTGGITGTVSSASYVEYSNVANKPTLVSGSAQVMYSGLTGVPSGILSGSAQVADFGIFAITGSNGFNGNQSITGSLTVTGQVVAQTLNVQQVTSSIVYSSGSNVFGNSLSNTQQFTGSVSITGSLNTSGDVTAQSFLTFPSTAGYTGQFDFSGGTRISQTTPSTEIADSMTFVINGGSTSTTGNAFIFKTQTGNISPSAVLTLAKTGAATFTQNSNSTTSNTFENTNTTNTNTRNILNITAGTVSLQLQAIHSDNVYLKPSTAVDTYLGYGNALRLASTGAATFTESLAITKAISIFQLGNSTNNSYGAVQFLGNATGNGNTLGELDFFNKITGTNTVSAQIEVIHEGTSGDNKSSMFFRTHNGTSLITPLTIYSTGTATFSSSVTANGNSNTFGNASLSGRAVIIQAGSTNQAIMFKNSAGGDATLFINGTSTTVDYNFNTYSVADALVIKNNGNVGISTSSPLGKLDVYRAAGGSGTSAIVISNGEGGGRNWALSTEVVTAGDFAILCSSTTGGTPSPSSANSKLYINSSGNVGIGTTSPTEKLHIYSSSSPEFRMEGGGHSWYIRPYNDNYNVLTPTGRQAVSYLNNGDVRNYNNTTTWQQVSDARVKENINTISDAMDKILALNPVIFDYKQEFADKNNWDNDKKVNNIGFIAQEFETIFPKYISTNEYIIGETVIDDFKSIDTGHLVAYLVKAIQEQQTLIESLKSRIEILEQ